MYMKLLEQTIKELKGEEIEDDVRATVNLRVDLRIDETYIPDMNQRLTVYRRMAAVAVARTSSTRSLEEVRDRYGPPPDSVQNLADYARIRLLADRLGLESIDREGQLVVLKFRPEAKLDPAWLFRVVQERERRPADAAGDAEAGLDKADGVGRRHAAVAAGKRGGSGAGGSWWTARAHGRRGDAGLHRRTRSCGPPKEDPRAEGGVFSRVSGLLRELSEGVQIR